MRVGKRMALPKKKGFRTITVGAQTFKWYFNGKVQVIPDGPTGRRPLELDFGWIEPYMIGWGECPDNEPRVVTPSFVAAAITYALNHGWDTTTRGGKFLLHYNKEAGFHNARNKPDG
jgi:hypothetical protein